MGDNLGVAEVAAFIHGHLYLVVSSEFHTHGSPDRLSTTETPPPAEDLGIGWEEAELNFGDPPGMRREGEREVGECSPNQI